MFDIRAFTHLGNDIDAVLEKQGGKATVRSVRAEIVQRVPNARVIVDAFGARTGLDAMRELDALIGARIMRRNGAHAHESTSPEQSTL
jgi:hypothetical protein